MRLEPLYRVTFGYGDGATIELGSAPREGAQGFWWAEGRCEGRIAGRFRGANAPLRRADGTWIGAFRGVIETVDGATILFDMRGYGRPGGADGREVVAAFRHVSDDERYAWLNDTVAASTGIVHPAAGDRASVLVLDVAELVWEPLPADPPAVAPPAAPPSAG